MAFYNISLNKPKAVLGNDSQSWNSMTILKDPPRSISSKRSGKVDLIKLRDHERSRYEESINVYPRGVNLFNPVQYNNTKGSKQSYLKKTNDVYRFEVETPTNTFPLSRTPISNIDLKTAKEAPNFNYTNVNILDKNKNINPEPLLIKTDSAKSRTTIGDFKNSIETNSAKINFNKILYNILTNKKSYLDFLKAHPEFIKKAQKSKNLIFDKDISTNKSSNKADIERYESFQAQMTDQPVIDMNAVKSFLIDNMVVDKENRNSINEEILKVGVTSTKEQNIEKVFELLRLAEGKIEKDNMKIDLFATKTLNKEDGGATMFDNKKISLDENYKLIDVQATKGLRKEEAKQINNVDNSIEDDRIKVDKSSNKSSYSEKNNFSLVQEKELDNRILKTEVISTKTSNGNKDVYSNSNTLHILPERATPGSFLRQQQGIDSGQDLKKNINFQTMFKNREIHRNLLRQ